jgi:hypothetical protein
MNLYYPKGPTSVGVWNSASLQMGGNQEVYGKTKGCHGHDRMVVGFTTIYAINAYHH